MSYQTYMTLNANRSLPPLACVLFVLAVTVLKWEERRQTRRALNRLDAHMLADIGVSIHQAQTEAQKAFWED